MNLETLDWDDELLSFDSAADVAADPAVPRVPSRAGSPFHGPVEGAVPITASLGDQQAAMVGQVCLAPARPRTPTAQAISCC